MDYEQYKTWPPGNATAKWATKKIAMMEKMFADGKIDELKLLDTVPRSEIPNEYQKSVHRTWTKLTGHICDEEKPKRPYHKNCLVCTGEISSERIRRHAKYCSDK
jgi:hypothetical protein